MLITQTGPALGQQKPADQRNQDDVIRINTTLVQLHALVTDRKGQVVNDLKQQDFEVFENGIPQEINSFSLEEIQSRQAISTMSSTPSAPVSPPRQPVPHSPARVVGGDWQSMRPHIVRNDSKGIEAGGQINATLPRGLYTLHLSFKDAQSKKIVQQTVDFEVG